jgi:hypothetical protein
MFAFNPAQHDPDIMRHSAMTPFQGLIHSLRWFGARSSLLLTAWSVHVSIANEIRHQKSPRPVTNNAIQTLDRAFHVNVFTELRALLDDDINSLALGRIAKWLPNPTVREQLNEHLDKSQLNGIMSDIDMRNRYFDYISKYASILVAQKKSNMQQHPLGAKARLVRRMANKAISHSSLDYYALCGDDLSDVVQAMLVLASAIHSAIGNEGCEDDLAAVERAGHFAAQQFLTTPIDCEPYTINCIRDFLPHWVMQGGEFPRWPDDFHAHGTVQDVAKE